MHFYQNGIAFIRKRINELLITIANTLDFYQYLPPTAFEKYFQLIKDHDRKISFAMIDTGDSIVLVRKRMSWFLKD